MFLVLVCVCRTLESVFLYEEGEEGGTCLPTDAVS